MRGRHELRSVEVDGFVRVDGVQMDMVKAGRGEHLNPSSANVRTAAAASFVLTALGTS
jgi:hypothetical protein